MPACGNLFLRIQEETWNDSHLSLKRIFDCKYQHGKIKVQLLFLFSTYTFTDKHLKTSSNLAMYVHRCALLTGNTFSYIPKLSEFTEEVAGHSTDFFAL